VVLAYFFLGGSDLMDATFYVRRRSQAKLWITLASTVVTLALYLVLIPPYKAFGAAYATLGGFVFHAALTYIVSERLFRVAYEWDRVATMLAAAVGCWSLAQFVFDPAWVAVSVKTMILFLYPVILWLTGQVAPEEKRVLYSLLDRARQSVGRRRIPLSPAGPEM
jgi:peptidoglycan biosynthesis protein MviN/MurJ (putative lipid II flippase)